MNRTMTYPGALPQVSNDMLQPQVNAMVALGFLMQAMVGTGTVADGLLCTPTLVPSMSIDVGPGSIITNSVVDSSAFGSLAADTTDALVKMGINLTTTVLGPFTAPATAGQSQAFLIEAQLSETDGNPVVLPYFNAALPSSPYSGPANAGTPQNTVRTQTVLLQVKAGSPATTGSQVTPGADSGFVGLWQVTIANGATTIVSGNIAQVAAAPFVDPSHLGRGLQPGRLLAETAFTSTTVYLPPPGTNWVEVEMAGGGAAGAGAVLTAANGTSIGGPGTSGAYGKGKYTSGFAGVTITIGAGGVGSAGVPGTNGSPSSFGALLVCPGGITGGSSTAALTPLSGGNGSTVTPTGANLVPGASDPGGISVSINANCAFGAPGGRSIFGGGAPGVTANANGNNATSPGSGGSGTAGFNNGAGGLVGGNGAAGLCIVKAYS